MTISKVTADGQFEIIPGCKVDSMGNHYRSVQLGMCAWCREDPFLLKRASSYDYSSTQLNLPDILGKELVQWAREHIDPDDLGAEGIETQPHVTVKFGLMPTVKPTDVARVVKDQSPVSLSFGNNYVFAGAADPQGGVPLYVSVNSDDLGHLNGLIKRALPNVETYSQYQPHVTIGYIKADAVNKYVGQRSPLYGMHVTLDDLQFSGSDSRSRSRSASVRTRR
jgi:2'-5' RNA ligase